MFWIDKIEYFIY